MLTGRREAPLQETAGLIADAGGLPALVAPADLTDAAAVEGLFAACEREHGRLDAAPLITDRVTLDGVPAAFETLRHPGDHAKILIQHGDRT